jgi:hypothetical protein
VKKADRQTGRIPVHIVTGPAASGKSTLIAKLCMARADWLGLVNVVPALAGPNVRQLFAGCPCCAAKVVLQVSLARALRETRAVRAFVELPEAPHAAALEKLLGEPPLGDSVVAAPLLRLPEQAPLEAASLDPQVPL